MSKSVWITSHLVVGGHAETVSGIREYVDTLDAALRALDRGTTAILPAGAFDLAKQVLLAAGRDEAGAEWQVRSALGQVSFTDAELDACFSGYLRLHLVPRQDEA